MSPALTKTPGTSVFPDEVIANHVQLQAIKRQAAPSDVVGAILFLTSEDAGFVTGQFLVADGGAMKVS